MQKRKNEDWLKTFVDYASYGEAPLKMLFWTGVSTICGALRRRVWLDMRYFQWVPNMYIVMVAPPGIVSKSTTANVGMNLLRKVPEIKFGPDVVTWQALIESMSNANELALNPETGEYLPMSCITVASDEFGTFLNPDDREMVDVLVSLWDGKRGTFTKVTKMSGNDTIENPWINVIACTTPSWIAGNFPEYMIGGGFTSRCVFIYTDTKRQEIAYPDENVPEGFHTLQNSLIDDLEQISLMIGEMKITPKAREWGRAWYAEHWRNPPAELNTDRFAGYLARKQTHMHKLAMVLSAAESSYRQITEVHMQNAEAMLTGVEKDMPKVFNAIGQTSITAGTQTIIRRVSSAGGIINKQGLYNLFYQTMSYADFELALTGAIQSGCLFQKQRGNEIIITTQENI